MLVNSLDKRDSAGLLSIRASASWEFLALLTNSGY